MLFYFPFLFFSLPLCFKNTSLSLILIQTLHDKQWSGNYEHTTKNKTNKSKRSMFDLVRACFFLFVSYLFSSSFWFLLLFYRLRHRLRCCCWFCCCRWWWWWCSIIILISSPLFSALRFLFRVCLSCFIFSFSFVVLYCFQVIPQNSSEL